MTVVRGCPAPGPVRFRNVDLQDFNMVKREPRPQTNEPGEIQSEVHPDSNLLELWRFGSESYSGKLMLRPRVRVPPGSQKNNLHHPYSGIEERKKAME